MPHYFVPHPGEISGLEAAAQLFRIGRTDRQYSGASSCRTES